MLSLVTTIFTDDGSILLLNVQKRKYYLLIVYYWVIIAENHCHSACTQEPFCKQTLLDCGEHDQNSSTQKKLCKIMSHFMPQRISRLLDPKLQRNRVKWRGIDCHVLSGINSFADLYNFIFFWYFTLFSFLFPIR